MDNLPSRQAPSPTMRTTLVDNILLLKILNDCAAACAGRGIPLLAIKGIAFLGREYPDLSRRRMTDIDLLVRRSDFARAERVLLDLGGARARDDKALHQDSYERLFHVTAGGFRVAIDLHHAFAHPQAFPIDYERVFADAEGHPLEDLRRAGVRRPSPGHSLVILALHQLYDAFPGDDRNFHDAQRVLECNRVDPRRLGADADRWGAKSALQFFLARGGALGIVRDPGPLIADLPVSRLRRGAMHLILDPARPDPFRLRLKSKRARQVVLFYLFCHRLRAAVGFPLHILRLQAAGWLRRPARRAD